MKFIISRYNNNIDWVKDYSEDVVVYDRSEEPLPDEIKMPNIGSDLYDKFTFIIDNYDNLPDVAVYTKGNLFKYITKEEFDLVANNKEFTSLLTLHHKVYMPVCFYSEDGMYNEINNWWYLASHPAKYFTNLNEFLLKELNIKEYPAYTKFAPGSNYILTKENILRHPKEFYENLRHYLSWDRYPGEAQIIERCMYYIFQGYENN